MERPAGSSRVRADGWIMFTSGHWRWVRSWQNYDIEISLNIFWLFSSAVCTHVTEVANCHGKQKLSQPEASRAKKNCTGYRVYNLACSRGKWAERVRWGWQGCQEQNCTYLRLLPHKTSFHSAAVAPIQVRASGERLGLKLNKVLHSFKSKRFFFCMLWQLRPHAETLTANGTKVHVQLFFQPKNVNEIDVESDLCLAYLLTSMFPGRTAGGVITTRNRSTEIGESLIQRM